MKRPAAYTQADVAKAIKAIKATGIEAVIELTHDKIRIVPRDGSGSPSSRDVVAGPRFVL